MFAPSISCRASTNRSVRLRVPLIIDSSAVASTEADHRSLITQSAQSNVTPKAFGVLRCSSCLSSSASLRLLLVLMAPAFTYIKGGTDVTSAAYRIKGVLDTARTYAKANNTYVFVGFAEVDSSVDPSVSPQVTTGTTPYGRVAVAVVASKPGTRQFAYATSNQGSDWTASYSNGANLIAIGKLQRYENLHFLVDFPSWTPTSAPKFDTWPDINAYWQRHIAWVATCQAITPVTPFTLAARTHHWRQVANINFTRVIYFDPTGTARIATVNQRGRNRPGNGNRFAANPWNSGSSLCRRIKTSEIRRCRYRLAPMSGEMRVYRP